MVREEDEEGDDPCRGRDGIAVSAVRDDRIFEIKSTYILQPGPGEPHRRRQADRTTILRRVFNTEDTKVARSAPASAMLDESA